MRGRHAALPDAEAGGASPRTRAGLRLEVAGPRGVVGADQGEGGHGRARYQAAGEKSEASVRETRCRNFRTTRAAG